MENSKPLIEQPEDNSFQAVLLYKEAVQYCIDNYGVKSKQVIDTNISIYNQDDLIKLYQDIVVNHIQNAPEALRQYLIDNDCIYDTSKINKEFLNTVKACYNYFEKYVASIDLFTSNIVGTDEREYFIDLYQALDLSFDDRSDVELNQNSKKLIQFLREKQIYVDKIITDYDVKAAADRQFREQVCFKELIKLYPEQISYGSLDSQGLMEKEHICDLFDAYLRSTTKNKARLEDYLLEIGILEEEVDVDLIDTEFIEKMCTWYNDIWVDYNSNEDGLYNYDAFRVEFYDKLNSTRVLRGKTFKQSLEENIMAYRGAVQDDKFKEKLLKTFTARTMYNFDLLSSNELERIEQNFSYSQ